MHLCLKLTIAALGAATLAASFASRAPAGTGIVTLTVHKAGVVIGGASGTGTLRLNRRTYSLVIGGVSGGFTFGTSEARLTGRIVNIRRPKDIEGSYGSETGGSALGNQGPQSINLRNEKGVALQLSGPQTGLMINADIGSMSIQLGR